MKYYERKRWKILFSYMLIVFTLIMTSCSEVNKQEQEEIILARIGDIVNYSKSPHTYDEPEGVFLDGEYTLTECDRHRPTRKSSTIEVYKLKLEENTKDYERLVFLVT